MTVRTNVLFDAVTLEAALVLSSLPRGAFMGVFNTSVVPVAHHLRRITVITDCMVSLYSTRVRGCLSAVEFCCQIWFSVARVL